MWSWITNAYNSAKSWVKGAVDTVKKAYTVIETVNSKAEETISKVNNVKKSWKEAYNDATDVLTGAN